MERERFDFIVIGAGPAGSEAAGILAGRGKVALVEREHPGGTCLNWGCIPTKALASAARRLAEARAASACGVLSGELAADLPRLFARARETVESLRGEMAFALGKLPLAYVPGEAKVTADGLVAVASPSGETRLLSGGKVLLATGSRAAGLPGLPLDGEAVVDSRALLERLFSRAALPARLAVIGGGAIGCEMAWVCATLGSRVTVLEAAPQLLPGMDKDVAGQLAASFGKQGIAVRTGAAVAGVERGKEGSRVGLAEGEPVPADLVLLSVGRVPELSFLDPGALGIRLERGRVAVDACRRTTRPGWYAAGDLTPGPMLAYTASDAGAAAARDMLGEPCGRPPQAVPVGVFCHPEAAQVGEVSGEGLVSARAFFRANSRARCEESAEGLVKVFADKETGVIRGFALLGPHATELIGECTVLVEERVTLSRYAGMLHLHPVLGESLAAAAEKLAGQVGGKG